MKRNRERIHRICFMFNNIGFMGIPLVVAIYPDTAVLFIVIGIPVPSVLESALSTIGATSMPLALIYIGGVCTTIDLKPVLKCKEIYAGMIVKMIVIPVAAVAS